MTTSHGDWHDVAPTAIDVPSEYAAYLARFEAVHGEVGFGQFVKHEGRLVKKLTFGDFEPLFREYYEVTQSYIESLDRGDTINDLVVRLVRERSSELLLESPA